MVITPTSDMNSNLKKGSWSVEEDHMLISYIKRYGIWNWSQMPRFAGLSRSGKSCRLRWMNYLKPNIKKGKFSKEEEETILHFHSLLGNRWSAIASRLPGRTDNDVKNYWHSHLKKIASEQNLVCQTVEQDSDDNPSPLFETTQQPADHDVFKSHFSFEHEASSSTSEDHKREFSSPGTFDDLQCFWDQLCPLENLEFGNNNNHMDAFYDDVFKI